MSDKAGKAYWDQAWEQAKIPQPLNPRLGGLNNYLDRRFHEYFSRIFADVDTRGKKLIELGCAKSSWLPYLAQEFGFEVTGIDYSKPGCSQARQVLANAGVSGEIFCGDFFSPPSCLIERFDFALSLGVVEHYEDTVECIRAFSRFLKEDGVMLTVIPNMTGMMGAIQRILDREIYDIHVPLDKATLTNAHESAGLKVTSCKYFLAVNLNVLNLERKKERWFYRPFVRLRSWISKAAWLSESFLPPLPPNGLTSPYINCLARKPG